MMYKNSARLICAFAAPVVEVVDNVPANQESPGTETREEYGIRARALYDYQAGKPPLENSNLMNQ
jgi:hypothetical protein